jgi:hypothetical protein
MVCIFGYIIIFAAFFLGVVFVLQTVGMLASMFAQLELTLLFSFFFFFFFSTDAGPFLSDFLRNHVSSKLENASARLVCRQWSTALLVPILHLTTVKLKQVQVLSTLLPKCCAINAHALGIDGAKALADALKVNSIITSINLRDNYVDVDGAKALANALNVNYSNNNVGVDGAKALADALKVNSAITSIDLSDNNVGVDGAKALADALKVNSAITSINLTYNKVGVDGAKTLADALKVNPTITTIDLSDNNVGDDGAKALADALKVNATTTNRYVATGVL